MTDKQKRTILSEIVSLEIDEEALVLVSGPREIKAFGTTMDWRSLGCALARIAKKDAKMRDVLESLLEGMNKEIEDVPAIVRLPSNSFIS